MCPFHELSWSCSCPVGGLLIRKILSSFTCYSGNSQEPFYRPEIFKQLSLIANFWKKESLDNGNAQIKIWIDLQDTINRFLYVLKSL